MNEQQFYYRWEWQLTADPLTLWPYVADTNRFNFDTRLPQVTRAPDEQVAGIAGTNGLGNGRRRLQLHLTLLTITWEEEPFEWVYPSRFGVIRHYQNGPLRQMRTQTNLSPRPAGGTTLIYEVWVQPRNAFYALGLPFVFNMLVAPRFAAVFQRYDTLAQSHNMVMSESHHNPFAPGGHRRLRQIEAQLVAQGVDARLLSHLVELIRVADDVTLSRLRPYTLADYWHASRRDVLELFLLTTRAGLLDFQWELLCPLCRNAEQAPAHLSDIPNTMHCHSCHIDYHVNFDQSVELTFTPNPAIRAISRSEFCVGGPQKTPHIIWQQRLAPQDRLTLRPLLEIGRYRLRANDIPGGQSVQVQADGTSQAQLIIAGPDWATAELHLSPTATLSLANHTDQEQMLLLERMAWSDQAATAAEVTVLQRFRDLFANEALRPDTRISVGQLTILFTDLRDSTRMYREIGDAPAFGVVMNHFDVLRQAIAATGGGIVKTIGDAVMAVFPRPVLALQAIRQAQGELAVAVVGERPLQLKAAIHTGPAIAVTLNERLDYFGSTINMAARMEKFSHGSDIILSAAVYADAEVGTYLAAHTELTATAFQETLRGFDDEYFGLWRITPTLGG